MADQAALIHHSGGPEIWRRFLLSAPDRAVNAAPWLDAVARREPVGTCRPCGGYLFPAQPYQVGRRHFYPATCASCQHETAAPGPKPSRKKAR
jgi:hypothetical protein